MIHLAVESPDVLTALLETPRGLRRRGQVWRRLDGQWDALGVADVPTPARSFPQAGAPFQAAALLRGPLLMSRVNLSRVVQPRRFLARRATVTVRRVVWSITSDAVPASGRITRCGAKPAVIFSWRLAVDEFNGEPVILLALASEEHVGVNVPDRVLLELESMAREVTA